MQDWTEILPTGVFINKIAEASYAEVYRVNSNKESSILKVMQLKIPSDSKSLACNTSIDASDVVSEIRIMSTLTEVPGFVTFKEAHLVRGKPPGAIVVAYEKFRNGTSTHSSFPHPKNFTDHSIFLALELGDAGLVLENFAVTQIDQVWDIFLSVVVALCRAEVTYQFEVSATSNVLTEIY